MGMFSPDENGWVRVEELDAYKNEVKTYRNVIAKFLRIKVAAVKKPAKNALFNQLEEYDNKTYENGYQDGIGSIT